MTEINFSLHSKVSSIVGTYCTVEKKNVYRTDLGHFEEDKFELFYIDNNDIPNIEFIIREQIEMDAIMLSEDTLLSIRNAKLISLTKALEYSQHVKYEDIMKIGLVYNPVRNGLLNTFLRDVGLDATLGEVRYPVFKDNFIHSTFAIKNMGKLFRVPVSIIDFDMASEIKRSVSKVELPEDIALETLLNLLITVFRTDDNYVIIETSNRHIVGHDVDIVKGYSSNLSMEMVDITVRRNRNDFKELLEVFSNLKIIPLNSDFYALLLPNLTVYIELF